MEPLLRAALDEFEGAVERCVERGLNLAQLHHVLDFIARGEVGQSPGFRSWWAFEG